MGKWWDSLNYIDKAATIAAYGYIGIVVALASVLIYALFRG